MNPSNVIHRRRAARNKVKESRQTTVKVQQEVIPEPTPEPKPVKKRGSLRKRRPTVE